MSDSANLWTVACQAPQARKLEWIAMTSSKDQTCISCLLHWQAGSSHIILNSEKRETVLLRWGTRQRCPLSLLPFNTMLEVPANVKKKKIQVEKEEVKLTLFKDDHVKNQSPNSSERKTIIARLQDTRLIYKSQSLSHIALMNKQNLKLKTQYHLC